MILTDVPALLHGGAVAAAVALMAATAAWALSGGPWKRAMAAALAQAGAGVYALAADEASAPAILASAGAFALVAAALAVRRQESAEPPPACEPRQAR